MQTKIKKAALAAVLLAFCTTLFSFSFRKGGDSFTIYLNNKLLIQQYLHGEKGVKTVSLLQSNYNDELRVSYSHCGQVGKSRTLILKDGQNKMVKQWRFDDINKTMVCKVKDILNLKKGSTVLQLVYTSSELPKGQLLASIVTGDNATAKN